MVVLVSSFRVRKFSMGRGLTIVERVKTTLVVGGHRYTLLLTGN